MTRLRRVVGTVGRRGRALLVFAVLDLCFALRLAVVQPDVNPFYAWLDDGPMPLTTWSVVWLVVALSCLAGAVRECDKVAFTGAIGIKVLWASLYLSSWVLGDVADAWVSAVVWASFAACVWIIAGWPEPIRGGGPEWTPPLP